MKDFEIDFDSDRMTTVLVGPNGTGKSNLLEALIIIFRDLDIGNRVPSFAYEITYRCHDNIINVIANPDDKKTKYSISALDITEINESSQIESIRLALKEKSNKIPFSKFYQDSNRLYLPKNVFGYYSGPSDRMEMHFKKHQENFYNALINETQKDDANKETNIRPLFYARLIHSHFVLLSFFSDKDPAASKFLNEYLGIESLESVLFVMKKPPWISKKGNPLFWNARGTVSVFLERLYNLSLAPLRLEQRVVTGLRKSSKLEHLYLFIKDQGKLQELTDVYETQQEFFKDLESTYISELIKEVRIQVKIRNTDGTLTYRELSEGEQQLLMVLGLLRFTKEKESLFLLDEPDTHLNPQWSIRYLSFLKEIGGADEKSHFIMATHDPLVVGGLDASEVRLFMRDDQTRMVYAKPPFKSPKGMGVEAILTSDLFGLRSALDLETLKLLDEKRRLSSKVNLSHTEKLKLKELNASLNELDFPTTTRDPLYAQFVKAISNTDDYRSLQKITLTRDEQEKQRALAKNILTGIIKKNDEAIRDEQNECSKLDIHVPLDADALTVTDLEQYFRTKASDDTQLTEDDHNRPISIYQNISEKQYNQLQSIIEQYINYDDYKDIVKIEVLVRYSDKLNDVFQKRTIIIQIVVPFITAKSHGGATYKINKSYTVRSTSAKELFTALQSLKKLQIKKLLHAHKENI